MIPLQKNSTEVVITIMQPAVRNFTAMTNWCSKSSMFGQNGQINNNDALASLFYLLTKFKRGAVCVNAFSDVDVSALPDASVEVIYSGLLSLLRCYDPQLASIKQTTGDRLEMITIFYVRSLIFLLMSH